MKYILLIFLSLIGNITLSAAYTGDDEVVQINSLVRVVMENVRHIPNVEKQKAEAAFKSILVKLSKNEVTVSVGDVRAEIEQGNDEMNKALHIENNVIKAKVLNIISISFLSSRISGAGLGYMLEQDGPPPPLPGMPGGPPAE